MPQNSKKGRNNFMQGLELSKQFFERFGKPMLETEFADILPQLAVGLCGSGSECFGYDDEVSRDHDFEAGFCIFVPEALERKREFQLERAYAKLPNEFMGVKKSLFSPVGGNRHGVIHTATFFKDRTGTTDGKLSLLDWFTLPENALLEATNGALFLDNLGEVTAIRERLSAMPEDVRLKKLASHLLLMAQSGQYNYGRCIQRGETGGAALAADAFVQSALQVIFLLNRQFMPYYKWTFRALSDLPKLQTLSAPLEFLISSDNLPQNAALKAELIEDIASAIIDELHRQDITKATCQNLETHAYSVNDHVADGALRNEHILYAV